MIDKDQVKTLLEIHGVSTNSSKDEIRTILLSAQYENTEIEEAILALFDAPIDKSVARHDGLHKIFYTDDLLKPEEVSALLGIDIEVSNLSIKTPKRTQKFYEYQNFMILVLAVCIAVGVLVYGMYATNSGPFHPTFAFSSN